MNFLKKLRLQHLHITSWLLFIVGATSLLAGIVLQDGELWQLLGLMLLLAGGIKVVVILLWRQLAGLETDRHSPVPPR
ncbi:MAG TPA: hypothetical protein VEW66_08660 [Thermomicrobiales bacterium]|nr:hypothetical protein [Thermomicrobiales bacterium]